MSLNIINNEFERFLGSGHPELLCIKGKWGVGKTYGWKKFVQASAASNKIALDRYSYVSLFGLESLSELRQAIFQNTVLNKRVGEVPSIGSLDEMIRKVAPAGSMKRISDFITARIFGSGAEALIGDVMFLSIRNQIVCFDDIERAGSSFDINLILGLANFLKEERHCKLVFLLNDEEIDCKKKADFERQIEKVSETILEFKITSEEAVKLGVQGENFQSGCISKYVIDLGINNIRIIKKIEYFADRIIDYLMGISEETIKQAIRTLCLVVWSKFQPNLAPSIEFIEKFDGWATALREHQKEEVSDEIKEWEELLSGYGFNTVDDLDRIIIEGVNSGYFRPHALREAAKLVDKQRLALEGGTKLSKAWRDLYHNSLSIDDKVFLDALYAAAQSEGEFITPLNINSAIRVLRQYAGDKEADDVISCYVKARAGEPAAFFDLDGAHHFVEKDEVDENLKKAFEEKFKSSLPDLSAVEIVSSIGRNGRYTNAGLLKLAELDASDFEEILESIEGERLRFAIDHLLSIEKSGHSESKMIKSAVEEALKRIGAKSPLRARKVERFGIAINDQGQ